MMKKLLPIFLFYSILLTQYSFAQSEGYQIKVTIQGLHDTTIQLAYHYGDKQYIKSSTTVDSNGFGVFQDTLALPGGMYMIVIPDRTYFEIMIDEDQYFEIETRNFNFANHMIIKGSEVNELMYKDIKYMADQRNKYTALQDRKNQTVDLDSLVLLQGMMETIDKEVKEYRSNLKKQNPTSFFVTFLNALTDPVIPEAPVDSNGNVDSLFDFKYYKSHLMDGIDYTDDRLLRTFAYHNKIEQYISKLTVQNPDSIIVSVDYLIEKSMGNKEFFKYTVVWLLNKYAGSKIMGMDAVYVHIAEKYYISGLADWADAEQLKKIVKSAEKLNPFLIGKKVPDLNMQDQYGNWHRLYDLQTEYTVLYFWDADCGHCRKETPKFAKVYERVKDKGVSFYAVSIELTTNHWLKFIEEHNLNWINVIDTANTSDFRTHFKIESTPVFYLLNKEKEIVAKRLNALQLADWFEHYIGPLGPFDDLGPDTGPDPDPEN